MEINVLWRNGKRILVRLVVFENLSIEHIVPRHLEIIFIKAPKHRPGPRSNRLFRAAWAWLSWMPGIPYRPTKKRVK